MAQGHSETVTGVGVQPGVLWLLLCTETWGGLHKSHQDGMPGAPRFPVGFGRSLLKLQMCSLAGLCHAHGTWGRKGFLLGATKHQIHCHLMLLKNSMKSLGFQLSIQFQIQQTHSTSYHSHGNSKDSSLLFKHSCLMFKSFAFPFKGGWSLHTSLILS